MTRTIRLVQAKKSRSYKDINFNTKVATVQIVICMLNQ